MDKVGCREKEKKVPTHVEPEASTGIFPTPWQYPAPPKRRTAACGSCVEVDTFPTDWALIKSEPLMGSMYTKETERDPQRHQRPNARVVDTLIVHRTRQGRLPMFRVRMARIAGCPFRNGFSVVAS